MKARSGGGITSKHVTQKPVRTGAPKRAVRPAGVAQIGSSVGEQLLVCV